MINLSMAEPDSILRPRIAVMGVGGAGGNAINNMISSQLAGCDFVAANTDSQALAMSLAPRKLQLGLNLSRGLGAGSKPEIGRAAAEEQLTDILACLEGSDMLFVTAGMGGGTGTGAAPVIARAARETGILTVGVVTKPFHFEGSQRMRQAEAGIADLQQYVDTLIVIPNQNLFRIANERTTFAEAFRLADEVLYSGVRGITDLMVMPGFMNLDFADVKTVMLEMGKAMMGTGEADGDNRAIRAAEAAISNPLLDDISMKGARGVLINITGGMDMTLFEVDQAANRIREEVDPEAQIKVGSTLGEDLQGKIRVSVIATGIDAAIAEQQKQRAASGSAANTLRSMQTSTTPSSRLVEGRPMPIGSMAAAPATTPVASASSVAAAQTTTQALTQSTTTTTPASTSPLSGLSSLLASASTPAQTTTFQPQATVSTTEPEPVVTSQLNVSSSYFSMPQMVTPQMLAQQQGRAPSSTEETIKPMAPLATATTSIMDATPQPMSIAARQAEMLLATQAAAAPQIRPAPQKPNPVQRAAAPAPVASPIRNIPPAARTIEPAVKEDIRVTQLTATPPTTSNLSPQATQRSQSLFQRITGFGLVRPSAVREEEFEPEATAATPQPAPEQPRLGIDATDRSTGSSQEPTDLLDIPAFLRRQTNH